MDAMRAGDISPSPSGTPAPLAELDPSPVDETPTYSSSSTSTSKPQADGYFPPSQHASTTLGLSQQRIPHYLRAIQKYSSITFSIFATFHITNTAILPLVTQSVQESSKYLLLTRPYYQSFPLEPILITIPLALHISSGLALRVWHRRVMLQKQGAQTREDKNRVPYPKVSGISKLGYAAVPLVLGHSFFTRMLPLWVEGGSSSIGLDFVGHGVALHRVAGFVGFAALVAVVGSHVVWGMSKWLGLTPEHAGMGGVGKEREKRKRRRWWEVNGVTALVVGTWAAGGIGIVARGGRVGGWVGKIYDDLYRRVPVLSWYL